MRLTERAMMSPAALDVWEQSLSRADRGRRRRGEEQRHRRILSLSSDEPLMVGASGECRTRRSVCFSSSSQLPVHEPCRNAETRLPRQKCPNEQLHR